MRQDRATEPFFGRVRTGLGRGAQFTGLDWVRAQFGRRLGIDPWPGTLNLVVDDPDQRDRHARLLAGPSVPLPAADPGHCDARGFPVVLDGRFAAAVIVPDIPGYPADQVELVASVQLRERLDVRDEDRVSVEDFASCAVDAVVFDVDGTLLNSIDGYVIAARRTAARHGYEVDAAALSEALNHGRPFWKLVIPEGEPDDAATIARLRDETMAHWPDVLAEHVRPHSGVAAALEALQAAGIRLGIYTGSTGESLPALERAGLLEAFSAIVTAADVDARKPHPAGLQACLGALGVRPERAAYVGDTVHDMQLARAAGALAIGALSGAGDSPTLTVAGAHRLIAEHADLPTIFRAGDRRVAD